MRWLVRATPRPLYPRERRGSHCIGRVHFHITFLSNFLPLSLSLSLTLSHTHPHAHTRIHLCVCVNSVFFWHVTPLSLLEIYWCFVGPNISVSVHRQSSPRKEAICFSEKCKNFCHSVWWQVSENCILHTYSRNKWKLKERLRVIYMSSIQLSSPICCIALLFVASRLYPVL
jgi:hypothetical protein